MEVYNFKDLGLRVCITILLAFLCLNISAEDFYYKTYNVSMQVHADNKYSVSEDMDAFFTSPRHGIVREWNKNTYVKRILRAEDGTKVEKLMMYSPSISNIQVSEQFYLETEEQLSVKIGDADVYVEGDHHYQINYDYAVGDDRVTTGDLFYFSLLGSATTTNVDEFSFAIHFDKRIPKDCLKQIRLFYGAEGDETNKASKGITFMSDTLITGKISNLAAYNSVSIFIPLPEGYYTCPQFDLQHNDDVFLYMTMIVAVLLGLVLIRECKPRNNFTTVIECWPPKNLSSADLGYIYDTTVDPWDIISLIPYFAHKGLLTIDTTSGHPVLRKKKSIDTKAPEYQKKLFDAFFCESNVFDTKNPSSRFAERWLDMEEAIKKANNGMNNTYSWLFIIVYLLAGLVMVAGMFACDVTGTETLGLYGIGIGMSLLFVGMLSLFAWDATMYSKVGRYFVVIIEVIIIGFGLFMLSCLTDDLEVYVTQNMKYCMIGVFVMSLFASVFMMRLSSMGKKRLEVIGHILGLKLFIETSEKQQLESLLKEEETYFYDILPYAVAFGLSEKWAKQFEGLNIKPADWYVGSDNSSLGMCHFMNAQSLYSPAMTKSVTALSSARAKAAASSGSSGGFSGGGFGGGGSHSW